jgi:hypothetical protein
VVTATFEHVETGETLIYDIKHWFRTNRTSAERLRHLRYHFIETETGCVCMRLTHFLGYMHGQPCSRGRVILRELRLADGTVVVRDDDPVDPQSH